MGCGKYKSTFKMKFKLSNLRCKGLAQCLARPRIKCGDGHHHQSRRHPSRTHSHGRNLVNGRNHVNRTLKQRMQKCGCVFSPMNLIVEDTSGVHNSIYAVRYCHHEDKCYCCTSALRFMLATITVSYILHVNGVGTSKPLTSIVCRMRAHP